MVGGMNAPQPIPRPATYQDVLDAPENMVAEIVGGRLHLQPRPASPHARAHSVLLRRLGGPFDFDDGGPGGWWIITEPELHLGGDVLVPDLAGWRRERMPAFPNVAWFELAPDWCCEVLSPSTRRLDLTGKRAAYAREGVGHLWFVDPLARTLEAFALANGVWSVVGAVEGDDPVTLPPFEAVEWSLSSLWTG